MTSEQQTPKYATREEWLQAGILALRATLFDKHIPREVKGTQKDWPKLVRVSCGWPKGVHGRAKAIGQCWSQQCSKDGASEIFVSPELDDPARVLDVVTHELVHAVIGCEHGHRKPFRDLAVAVGLEGKMTATVASAPLQVCLHAIVIGTLGPYPHAKLTGIDPMRKKQSTRMLKVECEGCGCIVRMTRQWLTDAGVPTCACGERMKKAIPE